MSEKSHELVGRSSMKTFYLPFQIGKLLSYKKSFLDKFRSSVKNVNNGEK